MFRHLVRHIDVLTYVAGSFKKVSDEILISYRADAT